MTFSMKIKNTQKDFQGASSPELATSSLAWLIAWLVMKLLRFVAEAKKLSNHHRTPISSSMYGLIKGTGLDFAEVAYGPQVPV